MGGEQRPRLRATWDWSMIHRKPGEIVTETGPIGFVSSSQVCTHFLLSQVANHPLCKLLAALAALA